MRKTVGLALLLAISQAHSAPAYRADLDPASLPVPFRRYTTVDKFDRKITFYLSNADAPTQLPLVLIIQGSGGQSAWLERDGKVFGSLQSLAYMLVKDKARVAIVEKVGVPFAFQPPTPGTAIGCPPEFLAEHTLERWTEANKAALRAILGAGLASGGKVLVAGHSEGGVIAGKVAAEAKEVTHVAVMSSGGPTQLFDFGITMPKDAVEKMWKSVQADPTSTEKFEFGHPHRYWSTFLPNSKIDDLSKFNGRIYAVQGVLDKSVPVASFDVLVAELTVRNKNLTSVRVEGGDHGYQVAGDPNSGMKLQFEKMFDWFFGK